MKRVLICVIVLVVLLDLALADGANEDRPGRRNRNRNRNRGNKQRPAVQRQSRGCKYERPQTKLKSQCTSIEPVVNTVNLNATVRNDATCPPTKELTFNCSKKCKYENPPRTAGIRPSCDPTTNERSVTQTIRSGMPDWCPATHVKSRTCPTRRRRPREAETAIAEERRSKQGDK